MSGVIHKQDCERFEDCYELYVLGGLEDPEANELAEHLLAGCSYCDAQLERALSRTQAISQAVPLVNPPARLRSRLAASIGVANTTRRNPLPWLVAIAASVALISVGVWQYQVHRSEQLVTQTRLAESARVSSMIEILAAPGTVQLPLTDSKDRTLHGVLYVHKKLGLAMVVDSLPTPAAGWAYESWVITQDGKPRPIESFTTDVHGRAVTVLRGPVEVTRFNSMIISMEPVGSVLSKPTTLVFNGGIKKSG